MGVQKVMIWAEASGKKIAPSFYELLSKAKEIFAECEAVYAAGLADFETAEMQQEMAASGVHKVFVMDDPRLTAFHPEHHVKAAEEIVKAFDPDVLLVPASASGEVIAPALGQRFRTGVAAHCVDISYGEKGFVQMVPAFGGKVIGEILTPNTRPMIASIKPGIFAVSSSEKTACEVLSLKADCLTDSPQIVLEEIIPAKSDALPVEQAEIVLCGGLGIGGEENWSELEKLAGLLSAAVGCTRPALDAGWAQNEENMIGTSGKLIRPKVYVGFGISGATHHVCGMKDAGTVISVNQNPQAESFVSSDYCAVGDAGKIIGCMIDELEGK